MRERHADQHQEAVPDLHRSVTALDSYSLTLSQDLFHHSTCHVGQPVIAATVAEGQLGVIEAQALQDGRVEIVDMAAVFEDARPKVVRLSVNHAALMPPPAIQDE